MRRRAAHPQTLLILYSYPSSEIAVLCVDFWNELLTVLSPPQPGSPVYHLLVRLIDASLPHLAFPDVRRAERRSRRRTTRVSARRTPASFATTGATWA